MNFSDKHDAFNDKIWLGIVTLQAMLTVSPLKTILVVSSMFYQQFESQLLGVTVSENVCSQTKQIWVMFNHFKTGPEATWWWHVI